MRQSQIPLIEIPRGHEPALATLHAEPERMALILASARKTYTPLGMRVADDLSRAWAQKIDTPYGAAVEAVDAAMAQRGAWLLNHSYEWGCTSGAVADDTLGGATLLRTLDWPFDGLGRALVATRCTGPAGDYVSLTWPGFAGVLTASAPGRFAASINQPPLPAPWGKAIGWPVARYRVSRAKGLPPTHLLRLAFETCKTFKEAVEMIRATPICIPAIFTLAGVNPGEAVTIERTERQSFLAPEPVAANHWAADPGPKGRPRDRTSHARRAAMNELRRQQPDWSLDWLRSPILVGDTRLVMMANPASGRLVAQGFEKTGAVTSKLEINDQAARKASTSLAKSFGSSLSNSSSSRVTGCWKPSARACRAWRFSAVSAACATSGNSFALVLKPPP